MRVATLLLDPNLALCFCSGSEYLVRMKVKVTELPPVWERAAQSACHQKFYCRLIYMFVRLSL